MYLAVNGDGSTLVRSEDLATTLDIAPNHLKKITADLADLGHITTVRGRGGGIRLAKDASDISIGSVIRQIEPDLDLTQCMTDESNCAMAPMCGMRWLLFRARDGFLEILDQFSLSDVESTSTAISKGVEFGLAEDGED